MDQRIRWNLVLVLMSFLYWAYPTQQIESNEILRLCGNDNFHFCLDQVRNATAKINYNSEVTSQICNALETGLKCLDVYEEACTVEMNTKDFTKLIVNMDNAIPSLEACNKFYQPIVEVDTEPEAKEPTSHHAPKNTNFHHAPCFNKREVMTCTKMFSRKVKFDKNTKPDTVTCNHYRHFHRCVESVMIMQCDLDEFVRLERFLMDHAKFLVWKCPEDKASLSLPEAEFDIGSLLSPLFKMKSCAERIKDMFKQCRKLLRHNLQNAAGIANNTPVYVQRKCCAISEFLECTKTAALIRCGLKGGKIVIGAIHEYQRMENAHQCLGYQFGSYMCAACRPTAILAFNVLFTMVLWMLNSL